ncbi:MAG: class I tRNA ligase family protein, partial [Methanothrix sp.]
MENTQPKVQFAKAYIPTEHQAKIYQQWLDSGAMEPVADPAKPAFSLIMPPPNANGNLHMGHALEVVIMDVLTRYHRANGYKALWLPGSDHAGIETQVVYEKKLEKEGRSRFQMTREQFYAEMTEYTLSQKHNMEAQLRMLGASPAWEMEKFTLDPEIVHRVYQTFKQLYKDGLIYRGERIVNYSVKYQTAYSDLEVVWEERQDPLYYIKYGPLTLATVRPETKFGDTAIAVNPRDKRYQKYIGQKIEVTMVTGEVRQLPVIADQFVKMDFGTGVVKVTPGHDPNDFE